MGAVNISPNQVISGMIIAEDVYSSANEKLVAKNTIVNPKIISKLKLRSIKEVSVLIPKALAERMAAENPNAAHANKIKDSMEFKKFKKHYLVSIDSLKDTFTEIIQNPRNKYDADHILSCINDILSECGNSMHTFDMLHCMREYDDLTYVHSLNVALICSSFAGWLAFSPSDSETLIVAGMLHDIGKTQIPANILSKPGSLTDEEYAVMKTHTTLGYRLLQKSSLSQDIKEAVLSHHERYNGTGYPQGLDGSKINKYAKIIAIADVYDAMTANRIYRDAICPFDVVESLEKEGYTKYDPAYLLPFLEHIAQSYINAPVLLSNSLIGNVVMINKDKLSRPIVKSDGQFYDLSRTPDIQIRSLL